MITAMLIDHVYTWVNPRDPTLNKLRDQFAVREVKTDYEYRAGAARIADHGELKLSIATAKRFVPFVRRTIILGSGDPPEWLSDFGDSVEYIPQQTIVPADLWPTFQSNTVESFIYRIPNLSEHYIYSNDDFFFSGLHQVADFFPNEGRLRVGLLPGTAANGSTPTYRAVEENGIRALQKYVNLARFDAGLPSLFKDPQLLRRLKLLRLGYRFRKRGLRLVNGISHTSQPYLKSEWNGYHQTFQAELKTLYERRFRSEFGMGVNFTYHHYLHAKGKVDFYRASFDRHLRRSEDNEARAQLRKELRNPDSKVLRFCLNDTPVEGDDHWAEYIQQLAGDLL